MGLVAVGGRVRVVEQVGVQEVAEKEGEGPLGGLEAEKETDCEVPETRVAVMVFVTEEPRVTDLSPPFAREKSNAAAVTVKAPVVTPVPAAVVTLILPVVAPLGTVEIGRASCREREEISVVAVSLEKKAPLGRP